MVFKCGHHETCMYRFLHRGVRKSYCLPCVLEYLDIPQIGQYEGNLKDYFAEKAKKAEEEKAKKKDTVKKEVKKEVKKKVE